MTDFDAILAGTLAKVNEGFEQALNDLSEVIENVSNSVIKASGCDFAIGYSPVAESPKGSAFRVYFDPNTQDMEVSTITIAQFFIPHKGYPIQLGTYRKITDDFKASSFLSDRGELEAHFADELANPDSAVIQAIGFGMRTAKKGDEIPF